MAKQKLKIPKRVAGIKIRKRQRKQLRSLIEHMDRIEEVLAAGTALVTALGLSHKLGSARSDETRSPAVTH
jgi:hypothetical protein